MGQGDGEGEEKWAEEEEVLEEEEEEGVEEEVVVGVMTRGLGEREVNKE